MKFAHAHVRAQTHVCDVHAKRLLKRACDVRACGRPGVRRAIAIFARFWVKKGPILDFILPGKYKKMQNLLQNYLYAINVRVRVRFGFWQNAHVRATCVRPKIECANVRACEAKNRRNSQIVDNCIIQILSLTHNQSSRGLSSLFWSRSIFGYLTIIWAHRGRKGSFNYLEFNGLKASLWL